MAMAMAFDEPGSSRTNWADASEKCVAEIDQHQKLRREENNDDDAAPALAMSLANVAMYWPSLEGSDGESGGSAHSSSKASDSTKASDGRNKGKPLSDLVQKTQKKISNSNAQDELARNADKFRAWTKSWRGTKSPNSNIMPAGSFVPVSTPKAPLGDSVSADDLLGTWVDSAWNTVVVEWDDKAQTQLLATLYQAPRSVHFTLWQAPGGGAWYCGEAKLDMANTWSEFMTWTFPDGRIAQWYWQPPPESISYVFMQPVAIPTSAFSPQEPVKREAESPSTPSKVSASDESAEET